MHVGSIVRPSIEDAGQRLGVTVSVLLYEYRAKTVLWLVTFGSMRKSIASLSCVRWFVKEKLLASPGPFGSGYSCMYFTAIGSSRPAGMMLPANGVRTALSGS